jgi:hypothetical protein
MASTVKRGDSEKNTDGNRCKKATIRPLLSSAPATLAETDNTQLSPTNHGKVEPNREGNDVRSHSEGSGVRRPHTPGGALRRAVDDPFCLHGRNDYHFVRVKQPDGKTYIVPVILLIILLVLELM